MWMLFVYIHDHNIFLWYVYYFEMNETIKSDNNHIVCLIKYHWTQHNNVLQMD